MISKNLSVIKESISEACRQAGRDEKEITIVAVTKGRSLTEIEEVLSCGIIDIGENRVQEAVSKYNSLLLTPSFRLIKWHMLGHLQTNKVKEAVRLFGLIHSVDSLCLAEEISKQAAKINKIQDILVEIKTSSETAKSGLKPESAIEVIKEIARLKNINIKGLMTIAPQVDNPEESRPYFRMLRELRERINQLPVISNQLGILSIGMTGDFRIAIEEGATIVRLGRAVFGG